MRVAIRGQLRAEISALSAAASTKKAGYLEQAGNVIDVEASAQPVPQRSRARLCLTGWPT